MRPVGMSLHFRQVASFSVIAAAGCGEVEKKSPVNRDKVTVHARPGARVVFRDANDAVVTFEDVPSSGELIVGMVAGGSVSVVLPASVSNRTADEVFTYLNVAPGDVLEARPNSPAVQFAPFVLAATAPAPDQSLHFYSTCGVTSPVPLDTKIVNLRTDCSLLSYVLVTRDMAGNPLSTIYKADALLAESAPHIDATAETPRPLKEVTVSYANAAAVLSTAYFFAAPFDGELLIEPRQERGIPMAGANGAVTVPLADVPNTDLIVGIGLAQGGSTHSIGRLGLTDEVKNTNLAEFELPWLTAQAAYNAGEHSFTWTGTSGNEPDALHIAFEVVRAPNSTIAFRHHLVAPTERGKPAVVVPTFPEEFAKYNYAPDDTIAVTNTALMALKPGGYRSLVGKALLSPSVVDWLESVSGSWVVSAAPTPPTI